MPDFSDSSSNLSEINIDPDNMTYEAVLELEQRMGDVSQERWKAICESVIESLPSFKWKDEDDQEFTDCCICGNSFIYGDDMKELPCKHYYHKGIIY